MTVMTAPTTTNPRRGTHRGRTAAIVALAAALGLGAVPLVAGPAGATTADPLGSTSVLPVELTVDTELEAAVERLRQNGLWLDTADDGLTVAPAAIPGLATTFGTQIFGGIVRGAGFMAFEELIQSLGYDSSQTAQALREIHAAIAELNVQLRAMAEKIEQLLDGQDRANFYNSYTASGQAANRLSTALASVDGWIAAGADPSASDLSDMQTVIRNSMSDLSFTAVNPTTGTIPLMMKAVEPSNVSNLDGYWDAIDVARDDYRAVLGQGLMTLDLMTRWDTTGTIKADLATLTPMATDTVRAMYGYGVEADGPGGADFVQLRNGLALSAHQSSIPSADRDVWQSAPGSTQLRKSEIEPVLAGMAQSYRPSLHGGQTLEQYLQAHGIPTKVVYTDTFHTHQWRSSGGALTRWYDYAVRVEVGSIVGNEYRHRNASLSQKPKAYRKDWTPWGGWETDHGMKADADAWAADVTRIWRSAANADSAQWRSRNTVDDGYHVGAHTAFLTIGTPTNGAGGFMVDLDPNKIEAAAFGTG